MEAVPCSTDIVETSALESVLLVASEPVSIRRLARLFESESRAVRAAVERLSEELANRGIRVEQHDGFVQLATAPENADVVRNFLRLPQQARVSRPALESLSIIAYRQPVTRPEIEEIRGVSSERVVANLLARGLIEERGRRESPGRPIQYHTTPGFLQMFGLSSIEELPVLGMTSAQSESIHVLGMRAEAALTPAVGPSSTDT